MELRQQTKNALDAQRISEERLREAQESHSAELDNLKQDLRQKSGRLSETNIALAKAADKIEELSEMKQKYMQKAKVHQKRAQMAETELAQKKDATDKLGKEVKELRKHLKFKDKEILRMAKENKSESQRLKTELHLQVENNKAIIDKMRKMQNQRKSGRDKTSEGNRKSRRGRETNSEDSMMISGDEADLQLFS